MTEQQWADADVRRFKRAVYAIRYRAKHRQRLIDYDRRWKSENRDRVLDYDERYKTENRSQILERKRNRERRKREASASRSRPNRCEVCNEPPKMGASLHWDHDHLTGEFRGWICGPCNIILGLAKDDPRKLDLLAAYLRKAAL